MILMMISLQEAQLLPLLNLLGRKSSSCLPRAEGRNANLNNENSETRDFQLIKDHNEIKMRFLWIKHSKNLTFRKIFVCQTHPSDMFDM